MKNIIVTIIISAISGYLSAKFSYNHEIKKKIYDERENTYIDLFKLIEKLKKNPFLVFNPTQFLTPFDEVKARLNLYASQEILNIIRPFNDRINEISEIYFNLFDSVEAENINAGRLECGDVTELDLEYEVENYMDNNVIDETYVNEVFSNLISQIRKELKTNRQ